MTLPHRELPLLAEFSRVPPGDPSVGTQWRRPSSVRRTVHWNVTWPAGFGTEMHVDGRARDLATAADGAAAVTAEATLHAVVDRTRNLLEVRSAPQPPGVVELVGARGGGGFRARLRAAMPADAETGTLPHLLLDDLPAVTLIGPYAWRDWPERTAAIAVPAFRLHGTT